MTRHHHPTAPPHPRLYAVVLTAVVLSAVATCGAAILARELPLDVELGRLSDFSRLPSTVLFVAVASGASVAGALAIL